MGTHRRSRSTADVSTSVNRSTDDNGEQLLICSSVVPGMVSNLYGQLSGTTFSSFKRANSSKSRRTWHLHARSRVLGVAEKELYVKSHNVPSLVAAMSHRYKKTRLWHVTVTFPEPPGKSQQQDELLLAFADRAAAERWRGLLLDAVSSAQAEGDLTDGNVGDGGLERVEENGSSPPRPAPAAMAEVDYSASSLEQAQRAGSGNGAEMPPPYRTYERVSSSNSERDNGVSRAAASLGVGTSGWQSFEIWNGLGMYVENVDPVTGQGGAIMLTAVMHGHPSLVFSTMWNLGGVPGIGEVSRWRIVERQSERSRVVRLMLQPRGGLWRWLCSPRELLVQQTYSRNDDGSYSALLRTISHDTLSNPAAAASPFPNQWPGPIRVGADDLAANITISPLRPECRSSREEQPESLLTFVVNLNLRGWLPRSRFLSPQAPIYASAYRAFLEPLLTPLAAVKHLLEHERFLVQPFMPVVPAPLSPMPAPPEALLTPADDSELAESAPAPGGVYTTVGEVGEEEGEEGEDAVSMLQAIKKAPSLLRPFASGPLESTPGGLPLGTVDPQCWTCPGSADFRVRGATYLKDKKKVPSGEPVFTLASVDLYRLEAPTHHIARFMPSLRQSKAEFTFIMQLLVPGSQPLSLTISWAASCPGAPPEASNSEVEASSSSFQSSSQSSFQSPFSLQMDSIHSNSDLDQIPDMSPFDISLARFVMGDDEEADKRRNESFKLIPHIVQGSWVVKSAVGSTPVLLGKKVDVKYFRGEKYFEVDVDIGSSPVAASIVGLVQGALRGLVIDMGVLIEGHSRNELPEQLLGAVRLSHLDLSKATFLATKHKDA